MMTRSYRVQKAIEYLEKYLRWETMGERHLETDIATVLNYIKELEEVANNE